MEKKIKNKEFIWLNLRHKESSDMIWNPRERDNIFALND